MGNVECRTPVGGMHPPDATPVTPVAKKVSAAQPA
jgi:hypothetical protein